MENFFQITNHFFHEIHRRTNLRLTYLRKFDVTQVNRVVPQVKLANKL